MKKILLATLLSGLVSSHVVAQHEAHTHGEAELNIAFEADQLVIELSSPAVNMVGFEHEPQNQDQQLEIEKLIRAIQTPENFFAIPARCVLNAIDFHSPFAGADDLSRDDESDEHHTESEDAHDHDEHSEHSGHDQEHEDEHTSESHQDIQVAYEWQCSDKKLSRIEVNLFRLYSGFEKIQAQWVVEGQQGAKLLTRKNASLQF